MTSKEFIEDWYGIPIPPDWDLEHEALGNVTIIQLEDMLNQFALHIAERAVGELQEDGRRIGLNYISNAGATKLLTRIKKLTQTNEE